MSPETAPLLHNLENVIKNHVPRAAETFGIEDDEATQLLKEWLVPANAVDPDDSAVTLDTVDPNAKKMLSQLKHRRDQPSKIAYQVGVAMIAPGGRGGDGDASAASDGASYIRHVSQAYGIKYSTVAKASRKRKEWEDDHCHPPANGIP